MSNVSQKPMITTIIPTYRRPKLLRRAIRSVLNQTYPHFQVCVYDNDSGDETASVVAEMAKADPRVKYHCHPENIGAYNNFVYGMEHVETPFFSFLSDDDILLPEFYQTAIEGFSEFPDAMFSAGSCICMTDKGKVVSPPLPHLWQRYGYYDTSDGLFEMIGGNHVLMKHIVLTSILFRREVIEKVGALDEDSGFYIEFDYQFRIAARFPFVVSKRVCAIFVVNPLSYSKLFPSRTLLPNWLNMLRNLTEDKRIPLNVRTHTERILTERIKRSLLSFGFRAFVQKDFEYVYELARIAKNDYHQRVKSIILYTLAKVSECFPPVYYLVIYLNRIRRFTKFRNISESKQLQEQFGHYAKFLEI